jgi:RNA polymerase sigma-70 factor (ECF subfamily)
MTSGELLAHYKNRRTCVVLLVGCPRANIHFSCQNPAALAVNGLMTDSRRVPKSNDDSIPTRSTLLRRLQSFQDEAGWQEFFEIYWLFIFRNALADGLSEADAEDVAQQTLIAVWKGLPKFRYEPKRAAFKTWLIDILKCRIVDLRRKQARRPTVSLGEADTGTESLARVPDPASVAPEARWDAEWEANLLRAARERVWKRLGQRERQIYEYYELKERKAGEAARELGVTSARVYVAKYRVEKELKKEIEHLRKNWF